MLLGISSIWGDDPFPSIRYQALLGTTQKPSSPDMDLLNLNPLRMSLTRMAFYLSPTQSGTQWQANPLPRLPRFNLIGKAQVVPDPQGAMKGLDGKGFDPGAQVILESIPDPMPQENGGKGKISVQIHSTDDFEFQVQVEKPQVLLMTDTYAAGWQARAYPDSDQKNFQVLPADLFARGIPLSAGSHHFDLVYDAPGFGLGKAISWTSLFLYGMAWGLWAWRRVRSQVKP
jgi:hypothetical protein